MRNAGLDELQAGIKIGRTHISNLRYADDNTLMTESEEELKNLLIRVKDKTGRADFKLNIKKKNHKSYFKNMKFALKIEFVFLAR